MKLDPVQQAAQEQFARQSHRYGQGHILENVEDVRRAVDSLRLPQAAQVLDVATGAGHAGLYLASLGHQVTLADVAEPMLARAQEAADRRGFKVQIRQHAAELLPYPPASFDLVTCRVAAHHFSSPADFIRETARVLKSGGHLLLIDRTIADDEPEAEAWLHAVEKLRDPSHQRLLAPQAWRQLCLRNGMAIRQSTLIPFKQPDLNWYFETAATPAENRRKVLALVANAPEPARRLFSLAEEDGKVTWWWQQLTLIAEKV